MTALDRPAGRVLVGLARLGLATVFAWAAVPKLLDPTSLAQSIDNYHLLPSIAVQVSALAVPVFELVIVLALVTGVYARGAALVGAAMLALFAGGMTQAIVRGINIDCGCFGSAAAAQITWLSVARNVGLIAVAAVVCLGPERLFVRGGTTTGGARPDAENASGDVATTRGA